MMKAIGKKRILVVDDKPMVSDALKMLLEFDGYEVQIAQDGYEALSLFEPEKFALIFTDFEMPGMNGHELASNIKARAPRQPIIMVTAYGGELHQSEFLPQIDLVIGKPWTLDLIRRAISKVLPVD